MASSELKQATSKLQADWRRVLGQAYGSDEERLAAIRAFQDVSMFPAPEGTTTIEADADGVPGEWVLAPDADPSRRLLYLHGGGYVFGGLDSHRDLAARLSAASGCAVLQVDYRRAPEHPYPAAPDDALKSFRWIRDHGPGRAGPADRVFIAGDSAGGALTLLTTIAVRDAGERMPSAAVTLSAWTDVAGTGESAKTNRDVDVLISAIDDRLNDIMGGYLSGADPTSPNVSPLYADFTGFPPLLMQVGAYESLLDDTRRVAEKAKDAGVDVTVEIWPEMFHQWQMWAPVLPEGQKAIDSIGKFLKKHGGR